VARGGLIPVVRDADLTDAERRYLERVLQAPALWPFQVVAGALGLDGAVEACRTRDLPAEVTTKLLAGGWTVERSIPSYEDVTAMLLAVKVEYVGTKARANKETPPPLRKIAEMLGADLAGVQHAGRVLRRYMFGPGH